MPLLDYQELNSHLDTGEYSVIVVGGGAAGIGAAIGARKALPDGRVLLLESESCLGGAATHRGVVSYCGVYTCEEQPKQAVGGVWDELKSKLVDVGATNPKAQRHRGVFQVVDPEGLKYCLDDLLEEHRIDVILHAPVVSAERGSDGTIVAVLIQERRGRRRFRAKAFVDCSGECDLAYHAAASTRYGNHGALNVGTMATRFGGIPSTVKPSAAQWSATIRAAKEANPKLNITKVTGVLLRLPHSCDIVAYYASSVSDARCAASISAAERSCRKQAQEYLAILRRQPGHENMYLVSTGHNFGTRESRHFNACYQLTKKDILSSRTFDDCIALGAWGMEWHSETDYTSSFRNLPQGTFEIPLRCLWSKDTPNLFAGGRCIDADQSAGSSVRVMGTALATGQAAGVAAAVVAQRMTIDFDSVEIADKVRAVLRKSGTLLDRHSLEEVEVQSAA